MNSAQIARLAALGVELLLVILRRARREATPEERDEVDRRLRETVEAAREELEAHPGTRE